MNSSPTKFRSPSRSHRQSGVWFAILANTPVGSLSPADFGESLVDGHVLQLTRLPIIKATIAAASKPYVTRKLVLSVRFGHSPVFFAGSKGVKYRCPQDFFSQKRRVSQEHWCRASARSITSQLAGATSYGQKRVRV